MVQVTLQAYGMGLPHLSHTLWINILALTLMKVSQLQLQPTQPQVAV